jgi:hypothetical protein
MLVMDSFLEAWFLTLWSFQVRLNADYSVEKTVVGSVSTVDHNLLEA